MTQDSLHRLIYASRRPQGLSRDPEAEVRDILIASINNNRSCALSGLLMAQPGWFLQALEGPAEDVARTYNRICTDSRHFDTVVRASAPATSRSFRRWTMCAPSMSAADEVILGALVEGQAFDPFACSADAAMALLSQVGDLHADLLNHQHTELMGQVLRAA